MVGNRKAETLSHSVIKHLVCSILERAGHKAFIEWDNKLGDIFDVVDWTDGLVYEIQSSKNKKIEAKKLESYLTYSGIRDVIFIYTNDFRPSLQVQIMYKLLKAKLGFNFPETSKGWQS